MLKFQDDYTTLITTFEYFILSVFTIIDNLYQQSVPCYIYIYCTGTKQC